MRWYPVIAADAVDGVIARCGWLCGIAGRGMRVALASMLLHLPAAWWSDIAAARTVSWMRGIPIGTIAVVIAMSACSSTPDSEPMERTSGGGQVVTVGASGMDIESRLTTPTTTSERDGSFVETFTIDPSTPGQHFAVRTRHTPGSRAAGDVKCWISVDGRLVSENADSGGFAIASCSW